MSICDQLRVISLFWIQNTNTKFKSYSGL